MMKDQINIFIISFFITIFFIVPIQGQEECITSLKEWRLWTLRYQMCIEDLESCKDVDSRKAYTSKTAAFNKYQSLIPKCVEFYSKLSAEKLKMLLACPADALITNSSGKKIGWYNGSIINEISGATHLIDDESEYYTLPLNDAYNVVVYGKGNGNATLTVIGEERSASFATKYFDAIPINSNSKYTGIIEVGGSISSLSSSSKTFPARDKTISSSDPIWSKIEAIGKSVGSKENTGNRNNGESFAGQPNTPPISSFNIMPKNPTTESYLVFLSTSYDPDNDVLGLKWYMDGLIIGTQSKIEGPPLSQGSHTIRLEATDSQGASHTSEKTFIVDSSSKSNGNLETSKSYEYEESTEDEIMSYLPYILGGLATVLILGFLFGKNKNSKSSSVPYQKIQTPPPHTPASTTSEQSVDDGFVTVSFCAQCGNAVLPGAKFCGNCGAPLTDTA